MELSNFGDSENDLIALRSDDDTHHLFEKHLLGIRRALRDTEGEPCPTDRKIVSRDIGVVRRYSDPDNGPSNVDRCMNCDQPAVEMVLFLYVSVDPSRQKSQSWVYCSDCAATLVRLIDDYVSGREHELLGDAL